MRWRWTLEVLKTATWVERNFCAEPALFKRCNGRGRDNAPLNRLLRPRPGTPRRAAATDKED
jgi:hypothetical protein